MPKSVKFAVLTAATAAMVAASSAPAFSGSAPDTAGARPDHENVMIINKNTKMCLAIGGGEKRKGKAAIQWPCIGSKSQQWTFSNAAIGR